MAGLTLYTMQSKRNFDFLGPFLMVGLLAMMFWFLFMMLFPVPLNNQLIALVGVLFFCGFVVYDTHMIMNRLTYDQHILGAINLYLDFLNLFLCILRLLSGGRE